MKLTRYIRVTALATSLVLVAMACSDASGTGPDDPDAGPSVPAEDGGLPGEGSDSSNDGSAESDTVQPKRSCTSEGWCHTVVPDGQTLRAIWSDGEGVAWTVSEDGNILRWDGTAWVQSHAAGVPLYAIWGSSPTDLWAGGGELTSGDVAAPGLLLHGTGASASTITWKAVPAPVTVRSIWGTSATDVWAVASLTHRILVGDPSFVLHYSGPAAGPDAGDVGTEWKVDPISTDLPTHFEKVWGTSREDVWLAGRVAVSTSQAQGRAFHRGPDGDGGFSWRMDQPTPVDQAITSSDSVVDIDGVSLSPGLVILARFSANSGTNYHTGIRDDGSGMFVWTQQPAAATGFSTDALSTVWGSGPNDIWMAGELGRLRHWDGVEWRVAAVTLDDVPVQKAIRAISGSGPNDVWVVGADIALHKIGP